MATMIVADKMDNGMKKCIDEINPHYITAAMFIVILIMVLFAVFTEHKNSKRDNIVIKNGYEEISKETVFRSKYYRRIVEFVRFDVEGQPLECVIILAGVDGMGMSCNWAKWDGNR